MIAEKVSKACKPGTSENPIQSLTDLSNVANN